MKVNKKQKKLFDDGAKDKRIVIRMNEYDYADFKVLLLHSGYKNVSAFLRKKIFKNADETIKYHRDHPSFITAMEYFSADFNMFLRHFDKGFEFLNSLYLRSEKTKKPYICKEDIEILLNNYIINMEELKSLCKDLLKYKK